MKEALSKLYILLWKNWIIQKRRKKSLIGDVAIPIFIGSFLLYVRYEAKVVNISETSIFTPFSTKYLPPKMARMNSWIDVGWNKSEILKLVNSTIQRSRTLPMSLLLSSNLTTLKRQKRQNPQWRLVWSPDHSAVNSVMNEVCKDLGITGSPVQNAQILEETMTVASNGLPRPREAILAGIVFPEEDLYSNALPKKININIRFPAELRFPRPSAVQMVPRNWLTSLIFPFIQFPGPREPDMNEGGTPSYYKEGFLRVEDAISTALLNYHKQGAVPEFNITLTRYPHLGFIVDPMIIVLQKFLPFLLIISFLFPVKTMTEMITTEKERRLKIVMNIMGLSDSLHWASWFIYSFAVFSTLLIILLVVFKVPIVHGRAILPGSDWSCLALFFLCYAAASTTYCFLMSTIFSKAGTASTVSGMVWFFLFVPYYVIGEKYAEISLATKCISSLLLNTGMAIGTHMILQFEGSGAGLYWTNMNSPATPDDDMTVGLSLALIMLDCVLYMCMALYIENVFPGEYGTPLPWYYPVQRSYWFRKKRVVRVNESSTPNANGEVDFPNEKDPENLPAGIRIQNLRKVYGKNKKAAVENLTLNVFEGRITVLLGFNGAGKTSTLSILTGVFPPTSGTAKVAGHDIVTDIIEARKNLGFCPQYNVLFDELNVKEHIRFYGKLKGLDKEQIAAETDKYINLLNLKDKSKTLSKHLSGGMKRKLSVALAMCGGVKVLIFDEPTAGMDPRARRSLWDLLISEKKGKSMLITTHHLDEANLLGDTVAIMSKGKLNCCGSTFFLKKHYSCGYHLLIIKKDGCDVGKVNELVWEYIPERIQGEDVGMELSYQLPDKYSNKFEELFGALEKRLDELKIVGFGVTPTTLEDVFMKISQEITQQSERKKSTGNEQSNPVAVKISENATTTGLKLWMNQIRAMFYKHIKYTLRSWKVLIVLLLITLCGIASAIFTIRLNNQLLDLPPLVLQLKDYPNGLAAVKAGDNCGQNCMKLYNTYKNILTQQDIKVTEVQNEDMQDHLLGECDRNNYIYRNRHILGTSFDSNIVGGTENMEIKGWFNDVPYHTAAIALANIYNAILEAWVGADTSVTFTNEPLPYEEKTKIDMQSMGIDHGFQIGLFVAFTYIFVSSSFILFPIQEREVKAKLLQMVSGVGTVTFWSIALIWNLLVATGPNLVLVGTLAAFREESYREVDEIAYGLFILTSFFIGILPLIFLGSLLWSKPAVGFILASFFLITTGIFAMLLVMILQIPTLNLIDVAKVLDWVFSIFPLFAMGRCFQLLDTVMSRKKICKPVYENFCLASQTYVHMCCKVPEQCPDGKCLEWTESPLDWDPPGFGRYILFLYITGIGCFLLLLALESGRLYAVTFRCRRKVPPLKAGENGDIDSDVLAERQTVRNLSQSERENYNLILDGVSKVFGKYVAVNNVYLAVKEGECFGLLGANGAGKTTTFRMLTGDEYPTSGNPYVKGLRLTKNMKKARKLMGYCPQFDALIDELTGREHLRMYCLIRGIKSSDVNAVSVKLARDLMFEEFLDKKVCEYSGGNKRKVSTAIALISNPPIVYLDEPTAGVDPLAKRHLWGVINKLRSQGTTIVLTSHSMEECEALCTRLTIMVKGQFKCLGTSQYLKNKFCQGYSLAIKIRKMSEGSPESNKKEVNTTEIEKFIKEKFPGAILMEKHEELLVYQLPNTEDLTLSHIFGLIESEKERLNIEDYSLGQTTLEQILLKLTQIDEDPAQN